MSMFNPCSKGFPPQKEPLEKGAEQIALPNPLARHEMSTWTGFLVALMWLFTAPGCPLRKDYSKGKYKGKPFIMDQKSPQG